MSKLCGICHFDLRPVSIEDGVRVRTALHSPGCFIPQACRQPGLLVGWAAGSDAPRADGLIQLPDRSICLLDGRIDNRKDLLRHTGLRPDCSDAALIFMQYRSKGVDGLHDVVGDWSLCIWDANLHEIVLASDYAGIRPLYYLWSGNSLYWSSSLVDLVQWAGITELDDTYVAGFLLRGKAPNRTPYAGIFPVPAGQAVSIARDGLAQRAFWKLPVHRETRFPDERQYEERMQELFRESVQARLAIGMPTCSELSGGLDSSSIVCMADRVRRETAGNCPDLITFSYTHENSPDERFYREVERACDVSPCHLELRQYSAADADRMGAIPAFWEPRFQGLARQMAAVGSGVLLTGQFGDFIMGNYPDRSSQVTEWLAKGSLGKAAREAYAWGRAMQEPIYPILWSAIREAYFSWVPSMNLSAGPGGAMASTEVSLDERLHARLRSDERERMDDDPWRRAPPGRRMRFRVAAEVLRSRALQTPETLQHLSYAHPYAHRPLVEFMLTIPCNIVFGPSQPRRLMRRAFAGLLPPLVLNRKSKASYESTYREALTPLARLLLRCPAEIQLAERGYVDRRSLIGRLEKFTQGLDCNETQLWQIILFEFWLRNRMASPRHPEWSAPPSALTVL